MEREWKASLERRYGVRFDRLFTLTNMPITRFLEWLVESGNLTRYMELLSKRFNPATVAGVMCRNTLSVGWDGRSTTATSTRCSTCRSCGPTGAGPTSATSTGRPWRRAAS